MRTNASQCNYLFYVMKEQLTKFKTQYDITGSYNRKALFEAQRGVYASELAVSDRLLEATNQSFTLKPLDVGFVQSMALKDDPKFKEIQKVYTKYNLEVVAMKNNPQDGLHLKKVVMESMLKFMRMMMLAPDTATKKTILDISYFWFMKHLNPKTQRPNAVELQKEIKKIVSDHGLLPKAIIERELPSEKLKDDLHEYRIKARTEHSYIDAPEHDLQNYHIHKVGYITEKGGKVEDEEERKRRRLMRIKFPKPNLDQYYLPPPEEEPKEPEKVEPVPEQVVPPVVDGQPAVVVEGGEPPEPVMSPEMAAQMEMLNQMGGEPEEPQEAVPAEEDAQEKKRGKLDPLVKVFLRKQQLEEMERSNEEQPTKHFQRFRDNYKQVLHREDELFARKMDEWASKRSRFKTQVSRRMQAVRMNHNQTATLPDPQPIQDVYYKTRISEAIRDGRSYVKGELKKQFLNTEGSLSCFDRRRVKTVAASTNKPFAQILEENKRTQLREETLDEIADIKEKFAKQKIFASLNAMKEGLLQPQEGERAEKVEYPSSLLSNPFFVVKKKKKKGKKKK